MSCGAELAYVAVWFYCEMVYYLQNQITRQESAMMFQFDPVEFVDAKFKKLPIMRSEDGRWFAELLAEYNCIDCLELGFHHGKSSAYIAAALKSMGRGHLTTIDKREASEREPNIDHVIQELDLADVVTRYYEEHSYTWRLMRFLEQKREFDFCFVDGGHIWDMTGFAFFLVDMLLRPGGVIVFDDIDWTIQKGIPAERHPKNMSPEFLKEYIETPQVGKVFELLVKGSGKYSCREERRLGVAIKDQRS